MATRGAAALQHPPSRAPSVPPIPPTVPKAEPTKRDELERLRTLRFFDFMEGPPGGGPHRGRSHGPPQYSQRAGSRFSRSRETSSSGEGTSSSPHLPEHAPQQLGHSPPSLLDFDSLFQQTQTAHDQFLSGLSGSATANRHPYLPPPPPSHQHAPQHLHHTQNQHRQHHHQHQHHQQPSVPASTAELDMNQLLRQWQQGLGEPALSPGANSGRSRGLSLPGASGQHLSGLPGPSSHAPANTLYAAHGYAGVSLGPGSASGSGSATISPGSHLQQFTPEEQAIIEEKRRRNTAASARFRLKKKARSVNMERTVSDLEGRTADLEKEARDLRQENNFLKDLIMHRAHSRRALRNAATQLQSTGGEPDEESDSNGEHDSDDEEDESKDPGPSTSGRGGGPRAPRSPGSS